MINHARTTRHITIIGRVQGVWYRGWAIDEATALGLDGWVRNRRDGSVEAVFAGPRPAVEEMIRRCWRGPPAARVDALDQQPWPEPVGPGFRQLATV